MMGSNENVVRVDLVRRTSSLGIASLILGIVAFAICWIPLLGAIGMPLSGLGLALGTAGLLIAVFRKGAGAGYGIAGVVVCALAWFIADNMTSAIANFGRSWLASAPQRPASTPAVASIGSLRTTEASSRNGDHVDENGRKESTVANTAPTKPTVTWTPWKEPVVINDLRVELSRVRVAKPRTQDMLGRVREYSEHLIVDVLLTNESVGRKIEHRSWQKDMYATYAVRDEFENTYRRVSISAMGELEGSMGGNNSIYPGKSATDIVLFEKPVEVAQTLFLTLPAENFGGEGEIRFEIPVLDLEGGAAEE